MDRDAQRAAVCAAMKTIRDAVNAREIALLKQINEGSSASMKKLMAERTQTATVAADARAALEAGRRVLQYGCAGPAAITAAVKVRNRIIDATAAARKASKSVFTPSPTMRFIGNRDVAKACSFVSGIGMLPLVTSQPR